MDEYDDAQLDQELSRLQRQLRIMEEDKKRYQDDATNTIRRQQNELGRLDAENTDMKTSLKQAMSEKNQKQDKKNAQSLRNFVNAKDDYLKAIEDERMQMSALDHKIKEVEAKIYGKHKRIAAGNSSQVKQIAKQKQISVLENRLDKAIVQFNKQLASNSELREEISHLRREKMVFENLYKKLNKQLQLCKESVYDVIKQSTQAYEQRDEMMHKVQTLNERHENDQLHFHTEMKDLQRLIDHDTNLKQFMIVKVDDRMDYKQEEYAKKKKRGLIGDRHRHMDNQIIKTYEEAFDKIKGITGERNMDRIASQFSTKEEENFALYNYVNELHSQEETLREEIGDIKSEMAKFERFEESQHDRRQQTIDELEITTKETRDHTSQSEAQFREIGQMLDQIKSAVGKTFVQIDCNAKPIQEMLGSGAGITNDNIMLYLGLIEQRADELLAVKQFQELQKLGASTQLEPAPGVQKEKEQSKQPASSTKDFVSVPTAGEFHVSDWSIENDDIVPLTLTELKACIKQTVNRQESGKMTSSSNNRKQDNKKRIKI